MTEFVKNFIESNIDAIDNKDWEEVVEQWYSNASSNFMYDDNEFMELQNVMLIAGIDFIKESAKARTEFMNSLLSQILEETIIFARRKGNEIKKSDVFMMVDCDLGFSYDELEQMLDLIAAEQHNLEVDFTCYDVR